MNDEHGPLSHPVYHSVKREPKFCRCRLCHAHFYADSIGEARQACQEHARKQHPEWGDRVCFCPG